MAWIEGLSSSNTILRDLTKIITQANKDINGNIDPKRNWQLVYPTPYETHAVKGEQMTRDTSDANLFHSINPNWRQDKPVVVYETDINGTTVIDPAAYSIIHDKGDILFLQAAPGTDVTVTVDYEYLGNYNLGAGLDRIGQSGRVVVKTTTTPVTTDSSSDPFGTDPDLKVTELDMFLEIEKPRLLMNPESGELARRYSDNSLVENHYHMNFRIFDRYDMTTTLPVEQVKDAEGLIVDEGAYVSEWSKFSWYQDFKETLIDELDTDPSKEDINDGIAYLFLETPGIYGGLPIQYWISTNNDRLAICLMGEPSIDYDSYLVSFAYAGKISSFDGSLNDTAGNFALTAGSSTIPCASELNPNPIEENIQWKVEPIQFLIESTDTDFQKELTAGDSPHAIYHQKKKNTVSYKLVAKNAEGNTLPSAEQTAMYEYFHCASGESSSTNTHDPVKPTDYSNFRITFDYIPENVTTVQIYRKDVSIYRHNSFDDAAIDDAWYLEAEVDVSSIPETGYICQGTQNPLRPAPMTTYNMSRAGVVRDPISGTVIDVKFPTKWGDNTATGVNDITMYKTRSGVYFQRHQTSFITPEEFMQKDAFNPSRWTNKFHLSPLYVVHGYDGYRGWLQDVVVVDDSSIVHLDELIVNKGKATEEIYKYFKLTAPFSFMQNSANASYGIGIKKV